MVDGFECGGCWSLIVDGFGDVVYGVVVVVCYGGMFLLWISFERFG